MSHKPCHHSCDFTDGDDPSNDSPLKDKGCCTPIPVKIDCLAPVVPAFPCDEEDPEIAYDPETEEFSALSTMYTNQCSPWTTGSGDPWKAIII